MDVVQERNGQNEVTAQLVRRGNIGGILSRSTSAGASFFGYDGGGNVTLLTDSNGNEAGHYRYDAFGNTLEVSGTRASENPYRFSTKELCSSGLYDFGYRFYSPASGTWLNRDPLREGGGVNLYGMVDNDPVNSVDGYGLWRLPLYYRLTVAVLECPAALMVAVLGVTAKPLGNGDLYSPGYKMPVTPTSSGSNPGGGGLRPQPKRGKKSDPTRLPKVNAGRGGDGGCNDCPADPDPWEAQGNEHGSTSGTHWHWIEYHQSPDDCVC